jgi:hypothetical protein
MPAGSISSGAQNAVVPLALDTEIYSWLSNATTLSATTRLNISNLLVETLSMKVDVFRSGKEGATPSARPAASAPWKQSVATRSVAGAAATGAPRVSVPGGNLAQIPAVSALHKADDLIGKISEMIACIQQGERLDTKGVQETVADDYAGPNEASLGEDEIFTDRVPADVVDGTNSKKPNDDTEGAGGQQAADEAPADEPRRESVVLDSKEPSVDRLAQATADV